MQEKEHKFLNRSPLVSVVIPAYNAAGFIEKTLDSVRMQTFPDYEIIVVDDGSKDQTKEIVDKYLANYGLRGCCVRQDNKGIAGARNTCIANSNGIYIALLDHDDIWYPDKLQRTVEEFRLHPETGLVSHHLQMVQNGKKVGVLKTGPASKKMYESILFSSRGSLLSPSAASFKKEIAVSIGGFRENPEFNTSEDFDFWLRLSKVTVFRFIDEILGEYTIIGTGASKRILYHCKSVEAVLKDHFTMGLGANPSVITRIRMRKRYANLYRTILNVLLQQKAPPEIQKEYFYKMLKNNPFNIKNIALAILWLFKR